MELYTSQQSADAHVGTDMALMRLKMHRPFSNCTHSNVCGSPVSARQPGSHACVCLRVCACVCVCVCVQSELVGTLEGHKDSVLSLAITPDNTTLFTGSGDNTISVCRMHAYTDTQPHTRTVKLCRWTAATPCT